jgi:5-methylcytosine-specific restriction endonuclease McrA
VKKPPVFKPIHAKGSKTFNPKAHIDALYKGEWAEYSKDFLKINDKCYSCGAKSEATDHLKVHLGDLYLFHSRENHIPLCHRCHNFITGKFDRRTPQDYEGKLRWLQSNRIRNNLIFPVKIIPWKWQRKTL